MRNGVQVNRSLPLLVASAFIKKDVDTFDTPINLNGDRADCRADNLMWRPRWFARRYNRQFKSAPLFRIDDPVYCVDTEELFPNSFEAACRYGLLESDVVKSIELMTYAWPTYQIFEVH